MSATAGHAEGQRGRAEKLGFQAGQVVQEIGYDDDCDEELRASIEATIGSELVDEDYDDVIDAVVLWWREEDGDLVDALVDALTSLADGGTIWLLSPKAPRDILMCIPALPPSCERKPAWSSISKPLC